MRSDVTTATVLALWNDVDAAHEAAYNDWHAGEHVPERLTVPGMLWGLRYRRCMPVNPGPRYLTLYGMNHSDVLQSEPYLRLLSHPTPASARMRLAMRNISRAVYAVGEQRGRLDATWLSVVEGAEDHRTPQQITGFLRAVRIPDARPLPWLQSGQSGQMPPDVLTLLAHAEGPWLGDGFDLDTYERLR